MWPFPMRLLSPVTPLASMFSFSRQKDQETCALGNLLLPHRPHPKLQGRPLSSLKQISSSHALATFTHRPTTEEIYPVASPGRCSVSCGLCSWAAILNPVLQKRDCHKLELRAVSEADSGPSPGCPGARRKPGAGQIRGRPTSRRLACSRREASWHAQSWL